MEALIPQLNNAIIECQNLAEEEGGIILRKDDEFSFVKITNSLTGQPIAQGLWEAEREEFAKKVLSQYKTGWRIYASLHTHPIFLPIPSALDLAELFRGFPINFIYSKKHKKITEWSVHPVPGENYERVNLENVYLVDDEYTQVTKTTKISAELANTNPEEHGE